MENIVTRPSVCNNLRDLMFLFLHKSCFCQPLHFVNAVHKAALCHLLIYVMELRVTAMQIIKFLLFKIYFLSDQQ